MGFLGTSFNISIHPKGMFSVLSDKKKVRKTIDHYPVGFQITTYVTNSVKMTFGLKTLEASIQNEMSPQCPGRISI